MPRKLFLLLSLFTNLSFAQTQVTIKPLKSILIDRQLSANAEVMALNDSMISAEVSAVVRDWYKDVGDRVQQGEVLVQLDARDFELQLAQARANLESAKARKQQAELRLKRAEELSENQYISSDDLLARNTDLAVQKAEYQRLLVAQQTAQRQLDKATIKAPFDGVITQRLVQKGQWIATGTQAMHMTQTDSAQLLAQIPSSQVATLNQAQNFYFHDINGSYEVKLVAVTPVIQNNSSVQQARFQFVDSTAAIGQSGQLQWTLQGHLLPADMIVKRQGQLGVFVFDQGQAHFQILNGAQSGRPYPIDPQTPWQLIVGGREKLQDGDQVTVK